MCCHLSQPCVLIAGVCPASNSRGCDTIARATFPKDSCEAVKLYENMGCRQTKDFALRPAQRFWGENISDGRTCTARLLPVQYLKHACALIAQAIKNVLRSEKRGHAVMMRSRASVAVSSFDISVGDFIKRTDRQLFMQEAPRASRLFLCCASNPKYNAHLEALTGDLDQTVDHKVLFV